MAKQIEAEPKSKSRLLEAVHEKTAADLCPLDFIDERRMQKICQKFILLNRTALEAVLIDLLNNITIVKSQ